VLNGIVSEHLSGEEAAFALSVIPATSIIGRLIGGALLGKFSATRFTLAMMLVQSAALCSLSQVTHVWAFLLGLGLLGFSVGNLLMLQPLLLAKTYGTRYYSRIFGLSNMLSTVGIACGPLLLGLLYVNYGSYVSPAQASIKSITGVSRVTGRPESGRGRSGSG
jgi:predicted MFS family arabinose efflux permease